MKVELGEDELLILFSGGIYHLPPGGKSLVVTADFDAIERSLHTAVEASGWCLHCFVNGVGGPGQGCAVESKKSEEPGEGHGN